MAARDFSGAGETFIDYKGQLHEILYAILTPLGYQAHVSPQALRHVDEQHSLPAWYQAELPHILNNPDLVVPNMEIILAGEVAEFIFGPTNRIMFGDEGQPGLEVGRNRKNGRIVAFMTYSLPHLYHRILKGLAEKPVPGRFSVESVDDCGKVAPICDPLVKNAAFPEIVQWVWEKYYSHLEAMPAGKSLAAETQA